MYPHKEKDNSMKNTTISTLLSRTAIAMAAFSLAACSAVGHQASTELSNKEKAIAVISSIETGDHHAISYINPTQYTQHNLAVGDGLEGFGEVMQALPEGSAKANVVRAYQDNEYVFLHTEYNFFGPKVGFDVFRFENGQVVEHWDNLAELATQPNPSGRTQLDGTTTVTDIEKTEENKAVVADFVNTILVQGNMSKINQFIDNEDSAYIQHNTMVADGLSGLGKALGELANAGMPMVYKQNHKILGEGNFVLAISEGIFLNNEVAFYDLFRLENGKIVEHWDVIENIPPRSEWKNDNGKFGF
jgi:predicted SnoaL-like aldol condensation-catalyzing enzyme